MAEVQDAGNTSEPSMEEILASIRKIIADEKDPAAPADPPAAMAEGDDVLELTQMVQDDGSVVDLSAPVAPPVEAFDPPPEPAPEPVPEPAPFVEPAPVEMAPDFPPPVPPVSFVEDSLLSEKAANAATMAFETLAHTIQQEQTSLSPFTPIGRGSRTLEDMVLELMRPLLKEWLDQNLPAIVDRAVQKEVARIAHRVKE